MPRTRGAQYLSVPYRATKIKRKVTKTMWTHVSFVVCRMCQKACGPFALQGAPPVILPDKTAVFFAQYDLANSIVQ